MTGDIIRRTGELTRDQALLPDMFGRPRVSKRAEREFRRTIEQATVLQLRLDAAKAVAVTAMLNEDQVRKLSAALHGGDPARQMYTDDYLAALHAVGIDAVLRFS